MNKRRADFAGSWYPAGAAACRKEIQSLIRQAPVAESEEAAKPVGGIVPHAGWYFSGFVACDVIRRLAGSRPPDVFVVFGMHLPPHASASIMIEGEWETPLGPLAIDAELGEAVAGQFRFSIETARRYTPDNTIELQLPLIKYFAENTRLLPIGAPPNASSPEIGRAVAKAAAGLNRRVRVIGSTDLTHYGANYGFSPRGFGKAAFDWVRSENDRRIIDAILAMSPESVIDEARIHQNACCSGAAAAAIAAAKELGANRAIQLAYTSSYEKSPGDSFVGYAGILFQNGS